MLDDDDDDDGRLSTSLLSLLSRLCPCSSVPARIFTTLRFQVYTYDWVMLLIIL